MAAIALLFFKNYYMPVLKQTLNGEKYTILDCRNLKCNELQCKQFASIKLTAIQLNLLDAFFI